MRIDWSSVGSNIICTRCWGVGRGTLHHIVPQVFLKTSKLVAKLSSNKDHASVCNDCHTLYEKKASLLREELHRLFGGPCPNGHTQKFAAYVVLQIGAEKAVALWRAHYRNPDLTAASFLGIPIDAQGLPVIPTLTAVSGLEAARFICSERAIIQVPDQTYGEGLQSSSQGKRFVLQTVQGLEGHQLIEDGQSVSVPAYAEDICSTSGAIGLRGGRPDVYASSGRGRIAG